MSRKKGADLWFNRCDRDALRSLQSMARTCSTLIVGCEWNAIGENRTPKTSEPVEDFYLKTGSVEVIPKCQTRPIPVSDPKLPKPDPW